MILPDAPNAAEDGISGRAWVHRRVRRPPSASSDRRSPRSGRRRRGSSACLVSWNAVPARAALGTGCGRCRSWPRRQGGPGPGPVPTSFWNDDPCRERNEPHLGGSVGSMGSVHRGGPDAAMAVWWPRGGRVAWSCPCLCRGGLRATCLVRRARAESRAANRGASPRTWRAAAMWAAGSRTAGCSPCRSGSGPSSGRRR